LGRESNKVGKGSLRSTPASKGSKRPGKSNSYKREACWTRFLRARSQESTKKIRGRKQGEKMPQPERPAKEGKIHEFGEIGVGVEREEIAKAVRGSHRGLV